VKLQYYSRPKPLAMEEIRRMHDQIGSTVKKNGLGMWKATELTVSFVDDMQNVSLPTSILYFGLFGRRMPPKAL
jgi:hypothetical protein